MGAPRLALGSGSRVEVIGVRHLRGIKGRLLTPVFPLGLAKQTVAAHLRHFLSKVEELDAGHPGGPLSTLDGRRLWWLVVAASDPAGALEQEPCRRQQDRRDQRDEAEQQPGRDGS